MVISDLSIIDWVCFLLVLLITVLAMVFGIVFNKNSDRKSNNKKALLEYWLMGRKLTLPFFVATLTSTWYGGIFGVTQIAFEHGIYNFFTQGFVWYIAYLVFAVFFAEKIHKFQVISLPSLVTKLYGKRSGILTAIFLIFKTLPIAYAIGIGAFIKALFGISLSYSIILGCGIVTLYCCFGGFKGLVFRDFVQFISMYIAVISVIICSYYKFGGYDYLKQHLPPAYFTISGNHDFSAVILWCIVAFITTFISPVFYQRCLAADFGRTAKKGIIISIFFWFIFDCCTTFGGMYARAKMPSADSLDAYLFYSLDILPVGFKGLFLAGIVSTILSTLDAFLFITSSLLAYDLVSKKLYNSKLIRRVSVLLTGAITMVLAIYLNGDIEKSWVFLETYASASIVLPIIWGYISSKRINENQYIASSILAVLVIAINQIYGGELVNSFYLSLFTSFSLIIIFSIYNYITNKRKVDYFL